MRTFEEAIDWMKTNDRPSYAVGQLWYYVYRFNDTDSKVYLCKITEIEEGRVHFKYINGENKGDYFFSPSFNDLFEYFAG